MFPCCNLDPIPRLSTEVVFEVVNNDCSTEIPASSTKIFYVKDTSINLYFICVVPVKSIWNDLALTIEMVQDLVSIVLLTCCEDW